ncbi:MAG: pyridoxal-phosphate dependent enzyme [Oligoflexia bacterium]|nr:pyridoxal-phosphate dependent enzyme [Oligoflexia bacterium]
MVGTLVCHGCGGRFDPARTLAFACPAAVDGDDIDHVLKPVLTQRQWPESGEDNPYLRYRKLSLAATLVPDSMLVDIIAKLDDAVATVDGHGFRITPWARSQALGCWFKDETHNVSGSHKGRHLMGVMIYLRVLESLGRLDRRPLAIASCGNAALAAAVVAQAARWPLQVYVPTNAEASTLRALATLGATVHACKRDPCVPGDPAVAAFRLALRAGALPFSVQGDVCGLSVEGGRTIGWELADQAPLPDALFIQVGGGALASAVWQGLGDARDMGVIDRVPRLYTVQTQGAWPLRRAWRSLKAPIDLAIAAKHRSQHMWPWETPPHSIAHGILDDETYDWWACCQGMAQTGGDALVVDEEALQTANTQAVAATGLTVSHTGSAGLAGLRSLRLPVGQTAGILLTGRGR